MKDREHEIACPCCGAMITVDAATGAVLSHVAPKKEHLSLEEAAGAVEEIKKRTASRFTQAMEERARQSEILEKKFQKAFEKASEDDAPPKSPFDLD
jgi:hypothetical protein